MTLSRKRTARAHTHKWGEWSQRGFFFDEFRTRYCVKCHKPCYRWYPMKQRIASRVFAVNMEKA